MTWGSQPAKQEVQRVKGWGSAPLALPAAGSVEGWWTRAVKLQALAQLSAQGSLDVAILERHSVPVLFGTTGELSATFGILDGLRGEMWARYLRSVNLSSVGALNVSVFHKESLAVQLNSVGALSALVKPIAYQSVSLGALGSLAASTMVRQYVAPFSTTFTTVGAWSYAIPNYYDVIEVIVLGGGGGGKGLGWIGSWGEGGNAGSWNAVTLTRGSNIPWGTTTIGGSVGAGGSGGSADGGNGGAGGASTLTGFISGAGGTGGSSGNLETTGHGSGNYSYGGQSYSGSSNVGALANGDTPGGGGGGSTITRTGGGSGARGQVWLRAYQV